MMMMMKVYYGWLGGLSEAFETPGFRGSPRHRGAVLDAVPQCVGVPGLLLESFREYALCRELPASQI